MRATSPASTWAIRRRTSAICASVISGDTSSARLAIRRSASSVRTSGGNATASRKISSDVAMRKDYSLMAVCDKPNKLVIHSTRLEDLRLPYALTWLERDLYYVDSVLLHLFVASLGICRRRTS